MIDIKYPNTRKGNQTAFPLSKESNILRFPPNRTRTFLYFIQFLYDPMECFSNMLVDDKDRQILRLLQEDMTKSYKAIAGELGIPVTTVYNRVKKMEENEVILGYKPVLDAVKLGLPTTSFLLITMRFKDPKNNPLNINAIAMKIAAYENVQEVHIVAGDWDILVKLKTKNVQEIGYFINKKLRYIEGVEKCLSSISFSTQKETLDIPL